MNMAILERVFEPISQCFTPAVARKLVKMRADPELQARIEELAQKCNEGTCTPEEKADYETYVRAIHFINVLQSKARRYLAKHS